MGLTKEYLLKKGFKELPLYTVTGTLMFYLDRRRQLAIKDLGTPREAIFISETDKYSPLEVSDVICLHDYDYEGYLTERKIDSLLEFFTNIKPVKQQTLRETAIKIVAEHGAECTSNEINEFLEDPNAVLKISYCVEAVEAALLFNITKA